MADEKPPKETTPKSEGRRRAATPPTKAQAEFDRYRARVQHAASAGGFAGPPAFSIGAGAGGGLGQPVMVGAPWGDAPYGGLGLPYGAMQAPPPVPPNSLTERLRYTLRLGVDVMNATLAGSLRVLGGVSDAASWAGTAYRQRGGAHACGCGCGHSACGCSDCCTTCDPCCHSGVSSCGCGCCC